MQSTARRYLARTKPAARCRMSTFEFGRTNPILIARMSWCARYFWQNEPDLLRLGSPIGANGTLKASEAAGVEFIDENGGGPGVRLRKPVGRKSGK
jgi:hypothetical protein